MEEKRIRISSLNENRKTKKSESPLFKKNYLNESIKLLSPVNHQPMILLLNHQNERVERKGNKNDVLSHKS
jgi:hypothetical protein